MKRAEGVRVAHPLFQAGGGGSQPTSALQLELFEISFELARELNRLWHSRLPKIGDPAGIMRASICFGAEYQGVWYATAIWSHSVARLLPQREWIELRRLAIAPDAPKNTATRLLGVMARLIVKKRPEVCRLISYQDTEVHTGTIYKASGWTPVNCEDSSNNWNQPGRSRPVSVAQTLKIRWEKIIRDDEHQVGGPDSPREKADLCVPRNGNDLFREREADRGEGIGETPDRDG